jgi:hypothetical protein
MARRALLRALSVLTLGCGSLAAVTVPSGCSSFSSDDPPPANADAAVRIEDGSVESVVSADAGGRCPATRDNNVLLCADFEDGIACTGWSPRGAIPEPTTAEAHGGNRSCRVCFSAGSLADMYHALQITNGLPANTALDMVAFVKNDNIAIPNAAVGGTLQTTSEGAQNQNQSVGGAPLGSTWTRLVISYTPTYVSERGNLFLTMPPGLAPGDCFFVDDVIVTATPP